MQVVLWGVAVYASVGLLFSAAFVSLGVGRIDAAAKSGSLGFRLLLVPGAVAFWPFLARRWWNIRHGASA